jgi:RimJ/RimL family protein N-acetyltransferase
MIYGDRIRLRAAEKSDLPMFVEWLNDPEVRQYLLMNLPLSLAAEEKWYESMTARPLAEQVLVIEAAPPAGNPEARYFPIGNTSFMDVDWVNRSAEVGIFIGEKMFWNRGYGREAMRLMQRHGFGTLNLNRIMLRVFQHNLRGIKAYEYAGFRHEGKMRQALYQDGRYYDVLIMSILHEEWAASQAEPGA